MAISGGAWRPGGSYVLGVPAVAAQPVASAALAGQSQYSPNVLPAPAYQGGGGG